MMLYFVMELLDEGAEAKIYATSVKGLACVIKERISKKYRIKEIDERLRLLRTRHEANLIARAARAGVNVPKIIDSGALEESKKKQLSDKQFLLCIELISGSKVRDYLIEYPDNAEKVCKLAGEQAAKMHGAGMVHSDLTTSNMIFDGSKVYFIDFGLGEVTDRLEDKAVDLHLLKECLKSKHYDIWKKAWQAFKDGYLIKGSEKVFEQLERVEKRGRYKGGF